MSKRARLMIGAGIVVAGLAGGWLWLGRGERARYVTAAVDRGTIQDVVGATGVLRAVTTVQVGSQVSGTILRLHADFNDRVTRGQVIARLDPSLFEARLAQARANLVAARAQVERAQATIDDTRQKFERARELAGQQLLPQSDLESAQAAYEGARAQLKGNQAAVTQAEAALNQAEVDLGHTVIRAPIDGVVLARNVDVGQTVAASFQAPVLFVIANDLTRMQVSASIDEADVGRVHAGQSVTFRVDAYPEETFAGRVEQVRLQPVTAQNVVTYDTLIAVDNPGLRLMPGMTATVTAVVRERPDALRVPTAALRFRPEGFEERDRRPGGAPGVASAAERPRGAEGGRGERRGPGGSGRERRDPGPGERRGDWRSPPDAERGRGGRPGLVFVLGSDGRPVPARVRLGLSDGRFVEVVEGLAEGAQVVTGQEGGERSGPRPSASSSNNPFAPQRFQPRPR
jgi:HlyD family secretion protein